MLTLFASLVTACGADVAAATDTPTPTEMIIITATLPPTQTPRPSQTPEPATPTVPVAPAEGQTTAQLNVRSAPSADSSLLGILEVLSKVQIVGKDSASRWWLVAYPDSPTGTGWITAQYVQATNVENVPVISGEAPAAGAAPETGAGPNVEAGSGEASAPAADLSLATAFQDGDSAQSPAVNLTLSKSSVRSFNYSSDISVPDGDPEDWVQFKLEGQSGQETPVTVVLDCSGSGRLNVELLQNSSRLQSWQDIVCGPPSQLLLSLFVGAPYTLHFYPTQPNNTLGYVSYTLTVNLR